jgi:ferritin
MPNTQTRNIDKCFEVHSVQKRQMSLDEWNDTLHKALERDKRIEQGIKDLEEFLSYKIESLGFDTRGVEIFMDFLAVEPNDASLIKSLNECLEKRDKTLQGIFDSMQRLADIRDISSGKVSPDFLDFESD